MAREFLPWLGVSAGGRWIDVGCGTGTLTGAVLAGAAPAAVTGVDPPADFIRCAREHVAREDLSTPASHGEL